MDILNSSNVERVLFHKFGPQKTKAWMDHLADAGEYRLDAGELARLQEDFGAAFSSDEEVAEVIRTYSERGYLMDTHTATCFKALAKRDKPLKTVVYSTAEWTKFAPTVFGAVFPDRPVPEDREALKAVSKAMGVSVPAQVEALFTRPVHFDQIVDKKDIEEAIDRFIV